MFYTVTLNPAVDYVMQLSALIPGAVNRSAAEQIRFGGKGINVAGILTALGIRCKTLGFIAGFTGDAIECGVRQMGAETDFIRLPEGFSRINVKLPGAQETEINGQGPVIPQAAQQQLLSQIAAMQDGDTLVLAGSVPSSLPQTIYADLAKQITGKSIRLAVDASGALLRNSLPCRPYLIKPNIHELAELAGRPLSSEADVLDAAAALRSEGAQNVLVSMGGDGALLLTDRGSVFHCGICKGSVRNAVGAGDSMLAGFLAGAETGSPADALALGTACGGATAFSDGLGTRSEIEHLLQMLPSPVRIA